MQKISQGRLGNTAVITIAAVLLGITAWVALSFGKHNFGAELQQLLNSSSLFISANVYVCAGLAAILSALGLPRQLIATAFGAAVGGPIGSVLATVAATAGCGLDYAFAKLYLRPLLHRRYTDKFQRLDSLLQHDTFLKALAIRLFPSGNNLLTSLLAGATRAPTLAFISGSALGYVPQMLLFAFLGAGAAWATEHKATLMTISLISAPMIGLTLYWLYRRRKLAATVPPQ